MGSITSSIYTSWHGTTRKPQSHDSYRASMLHSLLLYTLYTWMNSILGLSSTRKRENLNPAHRLCHISGFLSSDEKRPRQNQYGFNQNWLCWRIYSWILWGGPCESSLCIEPGRQSTEAAANVYLIPQQAVTLGEAAKVHFSTFLTPYTRCSVEACIKCVFDNGWDWRSSPGHLELP